MNCISLRGLRLFSLRFGLSTVGFRSSIGTIGTISTNRVTYHSIGTPLVNCISFTRLKGEVSRKFVVSFQNPKCLSVSRNHEIIVKFVINYYPSAIKLAISASGQKNRIGSYGLKLENC